MIKQTMNLFRRIKERFFDPRKLKKTARQLGSVLAKIDSKDIETIYKYVVSLSGNTELSGADKAADAIRFAADYFFGGNTGHIVRTIIQLLYSAAKFKKDIL